MTITRKNRKANDRTGAESGEKDGKSWPSDTKQGWTRGDGARAYRKIHIIGHSLGGRAEKGKKRGGNGRKTACVTPTIIIHRQRFRISYVVPRGEKRRAENRTNRFSPRSAVHRRGAVRVLPASTSAFFLLCFRPSSAAEDGPRRRRRQPRADVHAQERTGRAAVQKGPSHVRGKCARPGRPCHVTVPSSVYSCTTPKGSCGAGTRGRSSSRPRRKC